MFFPTLVSLNLPSARVDALECPGLDAASCLLHAAEEGPGTAGASLLREVPAGEDELKIKGKCFDLIHAFLLRQMSENQFISNKIYNLSPQDEA